jgi:hypothetical protein
VPLLRFFELLRGERGERGERGAATLVCWESVLGKR